MTPEVGNLSDTQEYSGTSSIIIGIGLKITPVGTASIKSENDDILKHKNTLCVPQLKMNLLSIQSMSKNLNCKFVLNGNNFKVKDNNTRFVMLNGIGSNGLYHLNPIYNLTNDHRVMIARKSDSIQTWHRRCGHPILYCLI